MFLPTTMEEVRSFGWDRLDVILISGDAYIDSPYMGIAVIGHVLLDKGYRVGIIAQPDVNSDKDIMRLGEPVLFWGISSGSIDSMVSNYTASKKFRKNDDLTPGGKNSKRPDRALIVYTNLIRRYFKETVPIVLGGIEASLRRTAHYDYWSNSVRRSVLIDAKADILIYGMGEAAVLNVAESFKKGESLSDIRGICYITNSIKNGYIELPSYEDSAGDKRIFIEMFHIFYKNNDPISGKGVIQKHASRYLVHNPPALPLTVEQLDHIYNLPYERDLHPYHKNEGEVRALDTIRFSITTHRGCYGECNFCAIALHQGRIIISRSEDSILKEAESFIKHPKFRGIIQDIGGPTANMYGIECNKKIDKGSCDNKRCLFPNVCNGLDVDHERQVNLLKRLRKMQGIKKVFISSGIRYDLLMHDKKSGKIYIKDIIEHHVSGQLKIAPEHSEEYVLDLMGKPLIDDLKDFRDYFNNYNKRLGKKQFLTYYFIAAHPGCKMNHMSQLHTFIKDELHIQPEQVQIFTPVPSTYSTLMYYTGINPFTGEDIFVEKKIEDKEKQKGIIVGDEGDKKERCGR